MLAKPRSMKRRKFLKTVGLGAGAAAVAAGGAAKLVYSAAADAAEREGIRAQMAAALRAGDHAKATMLAARLHKRYEPVRTALATHGQALADVTEAANRLLRKEARSPLNEGRGISHVAVLDTLAKSGLGRQETGRFLEDRLGRLRSSSLYHEGKNPERHAQIERVIAVHRALQELSKGKPASTEALMRDAARLDDKHVEAIRKEVEAAESRSKS